jgi:hypothetical protein
MTSEEHVNAEFVRRVFEDGRNRSTFDFLEGATATDIVNR